MARVTVEHLYIPQGTTYTHEFIVLNKKTFQTIDLTDYTALCHFREEVTSGTVLFTASTANAKLLLTPAEGKVTLIVLPAESSVWTWRHGAYDIEITSPAGEVTRIVKGEIFVDPEVTR